MAIENALMIPLTREIVANIINQLLDQLDADAGLSTTAESGGYTDREEDAYSRAMYRLEMLRFLVDSVVPLDPGIKAEQEAIQLALEEAMEEVGEMFQQFLERQDARGR